MNYEDDALSLIIRDENIETALEIARLVDLMKSQYQKEFWQALFDRSKDLLNATELALTWKVILGKPQYNADYAAVMIIPRNERGQNFLHAKLQQGKNKEDFPLFYGVLCYKGKSTWKEFPSIDPLHKRLENQGFSNSDSYYVGFRNLDLWVYRKEFLQRMAYDRETLVEELASQLVRVLHENVAEINTVNTAVIEAEKNFRITR